MKLLVRTCAPFLALAVCACSGIGVLNAITPTGGYSALQGISYDSDGLALDVYVPKHVQSAPVVIFFYGGSWQSNISFLKKDYRFLGQALAAKGFVAIVPDYRLYPAVRYPAFLDDCAKAVVWAHTHASSFGGDPERLVLLGHSAGAYNAAMLSLDPDYLRRAGGDRAWIKAMIGLAGPYDFLPLTDPALQQVFSTAAPLSSSQPIDHVDGHNPPMLLMAGNDDQVVYVKNTNNLYEQIHSQGGVVEKVIYPKMSHTRIIATTAARLQGLSDVMVRISDFIQRYVVAPVDMQP